MCIGIEDWKVSASCVYCGGRLTRINGCEPSSTLAVAIVQCDSCPREYDIAVRLTERRRTTRVQKRPRKAA